MHHVIITILTMNCLLEPCCSEPPGWMLHKESAGTIQVPLACHAAPSCLLCRLSGDRPTQQIRTLLTRLALYGGCNASVATCLICLTLKDVFVMLTLVWNELSKEDISCRTCPNNDLKAAQKSCSTCRYNTTWHDGRPNRCQWFARRRLATYLESSFLQEYSTSHAGVF